MSNLKKLSGLCSRSTQCLLSGSLMLAVDENLQQLSPDRRVEICDTFFSWLRFLLGESAFRMAVSHYRGFGELFEDVEKSLDEIDVTPLMR